MQKLQITHIDALKNWVWTSSSFGEHKKTAFHLLKLLKNIYYKIALKKGFV